MRRLLKILWIISLVAVFFLLILPYVSPRFRGHLDNFIHPFLPSISKSMYSDTGLQKENKLLLKKIARYESQQDYWNRLFDENEKLRELHEMPHRTEYDTVLSEVSVRSPLTSKFRFIIDKGAEDKFYVGLPVVVGDCLFGRLTDVENDHSTVGTLAMKNISISCRIKGSDISGILAGEVAGADEGELLCLLSWLPRDAKIKPGMLVETTGFSSEKSLAGSGAGLIPGSLKVGVVKSVSKNEIYQEAVIALSAHWQNFEYVSVLKKKEK